MKMEVENYLNRIGFYDEPKYDRPGNDYRTLGLLQSRHLKTVPYENFDIMRGIPISLKTADLYRKIVERRRGGYCFELNGLFAWLLRELGFKVEEYMGRYLRGESGEGGGNDENDKKLGQTREKIPMRRHRVLKVTCTDGDFLCDVGVGAIIPRIPVPMILGRVSEQGPRHSNQPERYKLESEPILGYVLYEWKTSQKNQKSQKQGWRRIYSFTEEPQLNIDYVAPSFYCEKYPDSPFRIMDMAHIFTTDGRKSVAGREFRVFTKGKAEVIVPATEAIYKELLKKHFGIVI